MRDPIRDPTIIAVGETYGKNDTKNRHDPEGVE
jgi:hypothetical protein